MICANVWKSSSVRDSPGSELSELYIAAPDGDDIISVAGNGQAVDHQPDAKGDGEIKRRWNIGDKSEWELRLPVQRVTASNRGASTWNRIALRREPSVYNIESVDQDVEGRGDAAGNLATYWMTDLLASAGRTQLCTAGTR
jgi:DUF1680 family protein